MVIFCEMSYCWPFRMTAIPKNYNNQLEHVVGYFGSHLGWQPLPKISKMTLMIISFKKETKIEKV